MMFEALLNSDVDLLIYLNNLGTERWDGFWLVVTNKFTAIPLYLVLIFLTYKKLGLKRLLWIFLFVAILIGLSDQTSNLFKYGLERLRPCHDIGVAEFIRLVKDDCGGLYSFFSAHAANSMAVAVFFGLLLRTRWNFLYPILLVWALLVGYSRIYLGVHYPLDVLVGLIVGALYGWSIYQVQLRFFRRFI